MSKLEKGLFFLVLMVLAPNVFCLTLCGFLLIFEPSIVLKIAFLGLITW
tara:strand:+ start:4291 stop:4437 length:147 start_codon:yes stop_codon:yes gene_type:complete